MLQMDGTHTVILGAVLQARRDNFGEDPGDDFLCGKQPSNYHFRFVSFLKLHQGRGKLILINEPLERPQENKHTVKKKKHCFLLHLKF